MSPQQWTGQPDIDGGSDIYSLSCVAYELLTGRPPFVPVRKNLFAWHEMREAHLTHEPPPLHVRRPDCPEGVERAVLRDRRWWG
jgi:serine/threonine protein kinase